ncbi:response regulator transcription factor [Myxococcota bacterium]|nr:response regulator transcription factor [Myxococcota bacterium]
MSGSQVLVVDDERELAEAVVYNLEKEGHRAVMAHDGVTAVELAERVRPDLVILDVMLPGLSGTEVCRRLRASPATERTPVMMLTARGEEIDRVVGFELGADDYMVKPFSMRELMLRVRAILRRKSEPAPADGDHVVFGNLELDGAAHRVWVDREEVRLTALELRLLRTFLQRRGRVQTREVLLMDVWGIGADVTTRTVDTHVKRLREKLGTASRYLETIRGVGYRMLGAPEDADAPGGSTSAAGTTTSA